MHIRFNLLIVEDEEAEAEVVVEEAVEYATITIDNLKMVLISQISTDIFL